MLTIFTIITSILIISFVYSLVKEWEGAAIALGLILFSQLLICWAAIGCTETVKVSIKLVQKDNYEILIGEDKIIITNRYNKLTQTFDDASTYNIITKNRDKYYLEYTTYNMYGYNMGSYIEVKDLRFTTR
jgi:ABC-type transport system involved in multi-copper enzyme maturation permease subunit